MLVGAVGLTFLVLTLLSLPIVFALGMSLDEVVMRATIEPARIIGRVPGLGTLAVGAPADLAIMELVDEPVEFVDTRNNKRSGTKKLVPWLTIRGGRPFGRPPLPTPFVF